MLSLAQYLSQIFTPQSLLAAHGVFIRGATKGSWDVARQFEDFDLFSPPVQKFWPPNDFYCSEKNGQLLLTFWCDRSDFEIKIFKVLVHNFSDFWLSKRFRHRKTDKNFKIGITLRKQVVFFPILKTHFAAVVCQFYLTGQTLKTNQFAIFFEKFYG